GRRSRSSTSKANSSAAATSSARCTRPANCSRFSKKRGSPSGHSQRGSVGRRQPAWIEPEDQRKERVVQRLVAGSGFRDAPEPAVFVKGNTFHAGGRGISVFEARAGDIDLVEKTPSDIAPRDPQLA